MYRTILENLCGVKYIIARVSIRTELQRPSTITVGGREKITCCCVEDAAISTRKATNLSRSERLENGAGFRDSQLMNCKPILPRDSDDGQHVWHVNGRYCIRCGVFKTEMSKLLLIHGTVTELARTNYDSATRILELETLLRESLDKTGDGAWHKKVREVLGDPFPAPISQTQREDSSLPGEVNQRRQVEGVIIMNQVCLQCESNARWNEAGGYLDLAERCRQYCLNGHRFLKSEACSKCGQLIFHENTCPYYYKPLTGDDRVIVLDAERGHGFYSTDGDDVCTVPVERDGEGFPVCCGRMRAAHEEK
jgi:hypothetical protein